MIKVFLFISYNEIKFEKKTKLITEKPNNLMGFKMVLRDRGALHLILNLRVWTELINNFGKKSLLSIPRTTTGGLLFFSQFYNQFNKTNIQKMDRWGKNPKNMVSKSNFNIFYNFVKENSIKELN